MSYRLTHAALEDLTQMFVWGAERLGIEQAEAYHAGLSRAFEHLAEFPESVAERIEITPPVRIYPTGRHLIIYREDAQGILILRVRHALEDWANDGP